MMQAVHTASAIACVAATAWILLVILHRTAPAAVALGAGVLLAIAALIGGITLALLPAWRADRVHPLDLSDHRAGLRDELKTAASLQATGCSSPLEALQIRRAQTSAAQLSPAAIVPFRVPPVAPVAALLLFVATVSTWILPSIDTPDRPGSLAVPGADADAPGRTAPVDRGSKVAGPSGEAPTARETPRTDIDAAARPPLPTGMENAAGASDRAEAALPALTSLGGATSPGGDPRIADRALVEALEALSASRGLNASASASQAAPPGSGEQMADRILLPQREAAEFGRTHIAAGRDGPDDGATASIRRPADAATTTARDEAAPAKPGGAEGEGRFGGQAAGGGAGSSGGPQAPSAGEVGADVVYGERTARLAIPARRVAPRESVSSVSDDGPEDRHYTRTRAQRAAIPSGPGALGTRQRDTIAIDDEHIPTAWRRAVRDYFLDPDRNR